MIVVNAIGEIRRDGRVVLRGPGGIRPGKYAMRLAIKAERPSRSRKKARALPVLSVGLWPKGLSLRREDWYGQNGR